MAPLSVGPVSLPGDAKERLPLSARAPRPRGKGAAGPILAGSVWGGLIDGAPPGSASHRATRQVAGLGLVINKREPRPPQGSKSTIVRTRLIRVTRREAKLSQIC